MKKILMILAIVAFVSTIESAVTKTTRASSKRFRTINNESSLEVPETTIGTEISTAGTPKERIHALRAKIKDAHEQINSLMREISDSTKELTQLEVHAHHNKSARKAAHA